jgi:hypothetical protein
MRLARILGLGVAVVLGISFVSAGDDNKDLKAVLLKLATAVEKNDADGAKKLVDELKKEELESVMDLMKPVAKGGVDVGFKEGIENKLRNASKKAGDAATQSEGYAKMAKAIAALAEVAAVKCPVDKVEGDKNPKDWAKWSKELKEGAMALGEAAKTRDPKKVKAAAEKVNNTCGSCHNVFK